MCEKLLEKYPIEKIINVLLTVTLLITVLRINTRLFTLAIINIIYWISSLCLLFLTFIYIFANKHRLTKSNYILFLFYLLLVVTTLFNTNTLTLRSFVYLYNTALYFFSFYIYSSLNNNKHFIDFYLKVFYYAVTIYALIAIIVYFTGIRIVWFNGYVIEQVSSESFQNRILNILIQPNQGAMYSVVGLFLSVLFLQNAKKILVKLTFIFNIIIHAIVIILSDSRVSMVVLFALIIFYVILMLKRTKNKKVFAIAFLVFLIIVANAVIKTYLAGERTNRIMKLSMIDFDNLNLKYILELLDSYTNGRIGLWINAIKLNNGIHVLFGNGVSCYSYLSKTVLGIENNVNNVNINNAHSIIFDLYLNAGLIGLILFSYFIISRIIFLMKKIKELNSTDIILFLIIMFIFGFSLFDCAVLFIEKSYNSLFWVLFGYLSYIASANKGSNNDIL